MKRSSLYIYIWAILLVLTLAFSVGEVLSTEVYAEENSDVVYNVVVFLRFSDSPEYNQDTLLSSEISDIYSDDLSNTRGIAAFYHAMSGGGITIRNTFGYSDEARTAYYVYNADGSKSYWNSGGKNSSARIAKENALLSGAMAGFNDSFRDTELTSSDLDTDDDGEIDSVTFVVLDDYPSDSNYGTLVWPHKWDFSSIGIEDDVLDCSDGGLKGGDYNLTFAYTDDGKSNMAVSAHEMGHVFGASDYYNGSYHPADVYDLMDKTVASTYYPSYMLVYTRDKYLGSYYGTTRSVTAPSVVTLTAVTEASSTDTVAIKIDTSDPDVYIMAEFRINNSATVYDRELPDSGVIVYKVDESVYGNLGATSSNPYKNHEVYVYKSSTTASSALIKENESRSGIKVRSDSTLDIGIRVLNIEGSLATVEITGSYFDEASLTPDGAVSVTEAKYVIDETSSRYGVEVDLVTLRRDTYEKVSLELYGESGKLIEKTVLTADLDSTETTLTIGFGDNVILSDEPPLTLRVKAVNSDGKEYIVYGEDNPYVLSRPYTWDEVYAAATYVKGSLTISVDTDDGGMPIGSYRDGEFFLDNFTASISVVTATEEDEIELGVDGDFRYEIAFPGSYLGSGTYSATLTLYYKNLTLESRNINFRILKEVSSVTLKAYDETIVKVVGNVAYMYYKDLDDSSIYFYVQYKDGTDESLPVQIVPADNLHVVINREIGGVRVEAEVYLFDTVETLILPDKIFYGTSLDSTLDAKMASGATKTISVTYGDYRSDGVVGSTQRVDVSVDYGYDYTLLPYRAEYSTDFLLKTVDGVAEITEVVLNKTTFNYGETVSASDIAYVKYISYSAKYSGSDEESVLADLGALSITSPDYSSLTDATRIASDEIIFSIDGATYSADVTLLNGISTVTHAAATNKQRTVGDTTDFTFGVSYANGYEHVLRVSVSSGKVEHDGVPLKRTSLDTIGVIGLTVFNPYFEGEILATFDLVVYDECLNLKGVYSDGKEAELSIEYGDALPIAGLTVKYTTSSGEKSYVLTRGSYRILNPERVVSTGKNVTASIELLVLKKDGAAVTAEIPVKVGRKIDTELLDTHSDNISVDYSGSAIYLAEEYTLADFRAALRTADRFSLSIPTGKSYVGGRDYKIRVVNADGYAVKEFRVVLLGDADGDGRLTDNDYRVYAEALLDGADDYILSTIGGVLDIDALARALTETSADSMKIAEIWVAPYKEDEHED